MSYEQELSTRMLGIHCIFCGRALRDPDSLERGWGPTCDQKYMGGMGTARVQKITETHLDVAQTVIAMQLAPKLAPTRWVTPKEIDDEGNILKAEPLVLPSLYDRWVELGGRPDDLQARWRTDREARRRMLSIGIWYASRAIRFGFDQDETVALRVDAAKLTLVAVQNFASAIGFETAAKQIADRYTSALEREYVVFQKVEASHRPRFWGDRVGKWIEKPPVGPGVLRMHAPYNESYNRLARENSQLFFAAEKGEGEDKGKFWRYFKEKNLRDVVNMLQGVYGDAYCLDPSGNLLLLPAMPLPEPEAVPSAPPTPMRETGEVAQISPETDALMIGQEIQLPDGTKSRIQWIDPRRKQIGVAKRKGKNYVFFSFDDVELVDGKALARQIVRDRQEANRQEDLKEHVEQVHLPAQFPVGLFPHQIEDLAFLTAKKRGIIADEQGLGKTPVGAVFITAPGIVVCPALLKVNWAREITKWRPDLTTTIIEGRKPEEITPEQRKADVVLINYDILAPHVGWLRERKNNTLIADEAQYLKNFWMKWNNTKRQLEIHPDVPIRAKAFYELHQDVPELALLSGTPIMNRTKELWPQLFFVDPKVWGNPFNFCERYCGGHTQFVLAKGGAGTRKKIYNCNGRSNSDELHRRTNGVYVMRHTKAEVLKDLPPKMRGSITVSLTPEYARKYRAAAQDFLAWVKANGGADRALKAQRAEALTRLTAMRAISAAGKAPAAVNWIVDFFESTQRPLVVMAFHHEAFDLMEAGLKEANESYERAKRQEQLPPISRPIRYEKIVGGIGKARQQAAIDSFQDGEIDVLLFSIAKATGVTLTRSSDMLFLERLWRPADQVQAEDRTHRIGQDQKVQVTYMDAEGTIDGKLAMLLMSKAVTAAAVIDGVELSDDDAAALVFGEMFKEMGIGVQKETLDELLAGAGKMAAEEELTENVGRQRLYDGLFDRSDDYGSRSMGLVSNTTDRSVADSWNDPL